MSVVNWGLLAKSLVDDETIEEAIVRLILAHNNDETAHLGAGQSLQSHKASAIIDHVVASVVADKIKDGEVKFEKTGFFYWNTVFESLDGFGVEANGFGATALLTSFNVELISGGIANNNISIRKQPSCVYQIYSWNKDREFKTAVMTSISNVNVWILMGDLGIARHVGFKIINNVLYATVANGTTESTLNLGTITPDIYEYRAVFKSGVKALFYVDGVYKGEITTNLPTGLLGSVQFMLLYLKTLNAETKSTKVSGWEFWQNS